MRRESTGRRFKCRICKQTKPPPSCDDDMPNACDDCWNAISTAPEALRARERAGRIE